MVSETLVELLGPPLHGPVRRVVSLVPSLTEAVFMLSAGETLVGRTRWCVRPAGAVEAIPVVGGTKNPDVGRVLALLPDVVLTSREENTRHRVLRIAERVPVWLTDPRSPTDVPALWRSLGELTGRAGEAGRLARDTAEALEAVTSWARGLAPGPRFLYLVWKDPWIAAGPDTYISRLLEAAGLRNAAPPGRGRYPKLDDTGLLADGIDAYLFSTEPFAFVLPRDLGPLWLDNGTGSGGGRFRIHGGRLATVVDAQPLSWYPSLTSRGLTRARELRTAIEAATTR